MIARGGGCTPLTVISALTVTCSPEGAATQACLGVVSLRGRSTLFGRRDASLAGMQSFLGVVSLWGRSTLFGGRDASLAGMQSFLAVMSSSPVQNSSHCSPSPDTLACIQSSLPRLLPSAPVVALILPWSQSSSGGGNSSTTERGMSGRGAALAPHPRIEVPPSGVVSCSSFSGTVHLLRPMTAAFYHPWCICRHSDRPDFPRAGCRWFWMRPPSNPCRSMSAHDCRGSV